MRQRGAFVGALLGLGLVSARASAAHAFGDPGVASGDSERVLTTRFEGRVQLPGGEPAVGTLVVSSAGGRALTDEHGYFTLEAQAPPGARSVHLTAVASGSGSGYSAQRSVPLLATGGTVHVPTLPMQAGASCDAQWLPTFDGVPGIGAGSGHVSAVAVFDDGDGSALYAAGDFSTVNGAPVDGIARWDGSSWSEVGGGIAGYVWALAVHDDGSGAALYAAGSFLSAGGQSVNRVARWDGSSWSAVGAGLGYAPHCLHVHDDGGGPQLYAGGEFTSPVTYIARWDGTTWTGVGGGLGGSGFSTWGVLAMATFDDGSGSAPSLFAAGRFTSADGNVVSNIARWDGSAWSTVGSGVTGRVLALAGYDPGTGAAPTLVVGGLITAASSLPVDRIAQWDGASWSALGSGVSGGSEPAIVALHVHDDGLGSPPLLVAGGNFQQAGGVAAEGIAAWNGSTWSALGSGLVGGAQDYVASLTSFDDGNGPGAALFAGGNFSYAWPVLVNAIASYRAPSWSALGGDEALDWWVHALVVHDDGRGDGPALYAGGYFSRVGGVDAAGIARWDGADWSPLGSGVEGGTFPRIEALAIYDDGRGGGPALYAAGAFTTAGGAAANNIARWDGGAWWPLGAGIAGEVLALAVYDGGEGPELYAGGQFQTAGTTLATRIARWDGATWRPVGTGLGGGTTPGVHALLVHDEGGGPALFVGGRFLMAGGVALNNIARWNGSTWSALGAGVDTSVDAFAIYDDGLGGGLALYAAGLFSTAGGLPAASIARWDAGAWSALGSGTNGQLYALAAYDDGGGEGPALYAGGSFYMAGGTSAERLALWDGAQWQAIGGDLTGTVRALVVHDAAPLPGGADLFLGGEFEVSTGGDSYLARYGGCRGEGPGTPYCFGDGSGSDCPCGNPGAGGEGCANSSGSGALLAATGTSSVASGDLVFGAQQLLPNQPALLFAGKNAVNLGNGQVFGDGLRCAGGAGGRLTIETPDAQGTAGWGPGLDLDGAFAPGTLWRFQVWYRDPSGSPCGSHFNLTNGYELFFTP